MKLKNKKITPEKLKIIKNVANWGLQSDNWFSIDSESDFEKGYKFIRVRVGSLYACKVYDVKTVEQSENVDTFIKEQNVKCLEKSYREIKAKYEKALKQLNKTKGGKLFELEDKPVHLKGN